MNGFGRAVLFAGIDPALAVPPSPAPGRGLGEGAPQRGKTSAYIF